MDYSGVREDTLSGEEREKLGSRLVGIEVRVIDPTIRGSGIRGDILVPHLEIGERGGGEGVEALVLHYSSLIDYNVASEVVSFYVEASTVGVKGKDS